MKRTRERPARRERPTRSPLSEQVEKSAGRKIEPRKIDISMFIPSGSAMLNCACSDNAHGAYGLGKIVTLPGASASGKTILKLTTFAEANRQKRFDEYDFYYDDVEEALEFDMEYLFGPSTAQRILPPDGTWEGPNPSDTIQDLQNNILRIVKRKKPFIYVLDSFDALTTDEELEKEYRRLLAKAKSDKAAAEIAGSYHTEKAKIGGKVLRMIKKELKVLNSTLIIVQQIRAKIGATFGPKTGTSGGYAPEFYSTHRIWLNKTGNITEEGLKIGSKVNAEVRKNKLTGKIRDVNFDVYNDYGVDDIGSCVDFLITRKHWPNDVDGKGKKKPNTFVIEELGITGMKSHIKDTIRSDHDLVKPLYDMVHECWNIREDAARLDWRSKYE